VLNIDKTYAFFIYRQRNNSQHERDYAPRGKTPVISLNAKRVTANMISAVTKQGKVRFIESGRGFYCRISNGCT